jgi:hypothetical protein
LRPAIRVPPPILTTVAIIRVEEFAGLLIADQSKTVGRPPEPGADPIPGHYKKNFARRKLGQIQSDSKRMLVRILEQSSLTILFKIAHTDQKAAVDCFAKSGKR